MNNKFFEGKDFKGKFKALMPKYYPLKYQKYIDLETELLKTKVNGANRVLEAGVGIGRLIPEIALLVEEFIGIDVAIRMLNEAKNVSLNFKNVKIEKLEIEKVGDKYPKDFFDYSLCVWNTLGNVDDEVKVLMELSKVTRKSIFITVYKKGTLEDRKNWYKTVGIPIREVDERNEIFYSESGLKSKSYSVEELHEIASKSGLKIKEIKILAGVVLWVELIRV